MTQEQKDLKDLLLKDLCARLPYGVVVKDRNGVHILTSGNTEFIDLFNGKCNIKPYLFPLSSMTEEHIFEINNILGKDFEIDKYGITDLIRNRRTCLSYLELDALFEYFNKYHFDYRGLIPMDLAIDATNLNIY